MMASFAQRLLQRQVPLRDDDLDENGQPRISPDRMSGVASSPQPEQPQPSLAPIGARQSALSRVGPPPAPMEWQPIRYTPTGRPEVSPTAKGDPVDIAAKQLEAANSANIHGHGFKNRLKSGFLNALSSPPEQRLGAFVQGVAAPNLIRKRLVQGEAAQNLGQQLGIAKERAQVGQMNQVPIVQNGQIVGYAPARTAAGAQIRATDMTARQGETKRRNDAYIGHLQDLPKEKRAEAARKIWMSGVADGDDEFKATLAKQMGLAEELPDTDKGTLQTDANGNFTVVHTRAGTAAPVANETTGAPVVSFKKTQETAKDERARLGRAAAMDRTIVMARAAGARMGDPGQYETLAQQADQDAADALEQAKAKQNSQYASEKKQASQYTTEANKHKARATQLRELAIKARGGQSLGPTTQSAPALKGRTMSQQNFDKYKKDHGDAAAQQLLDGGVTIRK